MKASDANFKSKFEDHIGEKFGMLEILKFKYENKVPFYFCKCDCGNEKWINAGSIVYGKQRSCGCTAAKFVDMVGRKFGRLTVLRREGNEWICKCDCGNEVRTTTGFLNAGSVQSCGCLNKDNGTEKIMGFLSDVQKEGCNLYLASRDGVIKSNTSGVTGVGWDKSKKRWLAQIGFKGRAIYLGRYKDFDEAVKARKEAEQKYFKPLIEKYKYKGETK